MSVSACSPGRQPHRAPPATTERRPPLPPPQPSSSSRRQVRCSRSGRPGGRAQASSSSPCQASCFPQGAGEAASRRQELREAEERRQAGGRAGRKREGGGAAAAVAALVAAVAVTPGRPRKPTASQPWPASSPAPVTPRPASEGERERGARAVLLSAPFAGCRRRLFGRPPAPRCDHGLQDQVSEGGGRSRPRAGQRGKRRRRRTEGAPRALAGEAPPRGLAQAGGRLGLEASPSPTWALPLCGRGKAGD